MNIAESSIRYRTVTLVMTVMLIGGGILAYQRLGRLEDPEFTIKEAQVFTRYPGASAMQVAEEVTDVIETAVQQMGQLDLVTSISEYGLSTVRVEMKDNYDRRTLPQVWDELRRKVNDARKDLPPGATASVVYDDFGDVYGIFGAIYGDNYTYKELYEYAKLLRRELLLVADVGKISLYGAQSEAVYVEISRARLAGLGIAPELVYQTLSGQNLVAPSGRVAVGSRRIRIDPTGEITSIEQIGELLILQADGSPSRLRMRDVATITRGYVDPPTTILRFNGHPAIGLGVSTVAGGNVVTMGAALKQRFRELRAETPIGIEVEPISVQSDAVITAINNFMVSLAEALAIVIGVLMIAMGLRSGLLIGLILLLTVLATFICMDMKGVMLERISLGALIIALGMLVDNAIVVVEGILINMQRGMKPVEASSRIVAQTVWPLFGATVVAVLAFAAIGASQDSTGEYCRSLFQVILFSLMASWVLAITVTPLFGVMFLKVKPNGADADPYGGLLFRAYRGILAGCIRFRWVTVGVLIAALVLAVYGFGHVRRSFFPDATRPQFMVHYWLPQGTDIRRTDAELRRVVEHVRSLEGVTDVAAFAGQGAPRFLLTYAPEEANTAYGLLLVGVTDYHQLQDRIDELQTYFAQEHPDAQAFCRRFVMGPGDPNKIQTRLRGPDPDVLRELAADIRKVMVEEPGATDVSDDWRPRVPRVRPLVADAQARSVGITRGQIGAALQSASEGTQIGVFRERDELLPIVARSPADERHDVQLLKDVQIWSPVAQASIPLGQVVLGFETVSENPIVRRRNRLPCITVRCDPKDGEASALFETLRPRIEAVYDRFFAERRLEGYTLEWGGEYENSSDAQAAIAGKLPVIGLLMMLVVVCLFNSIAKPLVIFLTVPLAIIGVSIGLLVTGQPFGFMALLGFLSLTGMLIKNAIVLVDEINTQLAAGQAPFAAVVESGVSRARPVAMAALTTVLGMIPLLADAFFVSMAVTIMFGLTFATILTLLVVPVLYTVFYRIPTAPEG